MPSLPSALPSALAVAAPDNIARPPLDTGDVAVAVVATAAVDDDAAAAAADADAADTSDGVRSASSIISMAVVSNRTTVLMTRRHTRRASRGSMIDGRLREKGREMRNGRRH